jgi:hypothetical protein
MIRAHAAGTDPDIENIKRKFDGLTRLYSANHERYESLIQKRSIQLGQLVNSNSSGRNSTDLHDLILLNIHKLKDATNLLENITRISTTIADHLKEYQQLKTTLLHLDNPVNMPKSPPVVTITPTGSAVVDGNAIVGHGSHALNVEELQRKMGSQAATNVQAPSSSPVPRNWRHRNPQHSKSMLPLSTEGSNEGSNQGWVGGSKTTQVGGRAAYSLPFSSHLYVKAVTELKPLTPENNPTFYKELEKAILDKTIQPVLATTDTENESASHDTLSPAAQSANNPNVIKNLIMNLDATTEDARTSIIKKYEDLVMMCDKTTALKLIKPRLNPKEGEKAPSDEKLLTMLGWNGTVNELLYDINKRIKGGIVFVQGLFSFFCFYNGNFSIGFSRHCGRNYVCMLNWVIIVAFRLKIRDPARYTDALIIELIEKMHHALLLENSNVGNFIKNTVGNTEVYVTDSKTFMKDYIFDYGDLKVLVEGIKSEIQKIPEPSSSDGGLYQHNTTHKPPTHKTVKGAAGHKGGNKVTTRKHRRPTIHNVGHTVKVAQKPTDVNTIKTRRIHHAVKT